MTNPLFWEQSIDCISNENKICNTETELCGPYEYINQNETKLPKTHTPNIPIRHVSDHVLS